MKLLALKVYFFLATTCPISQQYTAYINQFTISAKEMGIETILVFPKNIKNIKHEIAYFKDKYLLTSRIKIDRTHKLAKKLNATVTPEVFVVDEKNNIVYHGAIDNWFYALGQNRINITEHYLDDAISQWIKKQTITINYSKPIGCFIETARSKR